MINSRMPEEESGRGLTLAEIAERAYGRFHRPEYIEPDPLQLVHGIVDRLEREASAFIAASFALGRVQSILNIVTAIFERLTGNSRSVRAALLELGFGDLRELFGDFAYRFFGPDEIAGFLFAVGETLRLRGSLEDEFARGIRPPGGGDAASTVVPLARFSRVLRERCPVPCGILLTNPEKGASKRMHLFLRWMIREDRIDPGGWNCLKPESLIVPMDTHMLRISRHLGLTGRRTADLRTAIEVTEAFRAFRPDDPARYDFCLTRYGIHPDGRLSDLPVPSGW